MNERGVTVSQSVSQSSTIYSYLLYSSSWYKITLFFFFFFFPLRSRIFVLVHFLGPLVTKEDISFHSVITRGVADLHNTRVALVRRHLHFIRIAVIDRFEVAGNEMNAAGGG